MFILKIWLFDLKVVKCNCLITKKYIYEYCFLSVFVLILFCCQQSRDNALSAFIQGVDKGRRFL